MENQVNLIMCLPGDSQLRPQVCTGNKSLCKFIYSSCYQATKC